MLRAEVDAYWATVFRCEHDDVWPPGVFVTAHAGLLDGYQGVFLFSRGDACRVSAPPDIVEPLRDALRGSRAPEVFDGHAVVDILGDRVERVIGPNWHGYVDHDGYRPATGAGCREITEADAPALAVLREACGPGDWAEASFDHAQALFGCFHDERLVAASNLTDWRLGRDRIGVVTRPDRRGRGYGAVAASAATGRALRTAPVAEWRARGTNAPSIRVASRLGFVHYGENLAVRLR
jgi:hypothetical protein